MYRKNIKEEWDIYPKKKCPWMKMDEICRHPEHKPPMHLYIPPGETRTHRCPGCGKETIMRGSNIIFMNTLEKVIPLNILNNKIK